MMKSLYPLFVTANVSLQVGPHDYKKLHQFPLLSLYNDINRLLQSALDEEFSPGEHWSNDWVLMEQLAGSIEVFEGASEARECLDDWIQGKELNQTIKWFEFRLDASCAMGHIYLIGDYGPVEITTNPVFKSDMFDANGIARAIDL